MATTELKNAIASRKSPPKLMVGEDTALATSARAVAVDSNGNVRVASSGGALATETTVAAIKTATEKVATETGVGTGLLVRQPTAGNFNCTEASASAIKTAVEKVATEVAVGDGLMVRSDTAANMLTTEASASDIKTAVEKVDDWDAVHDSPATSDGVRLMGTAYADPSVLPADVSGDADDVRVACNRKGVLYTSDAYLGFAEDSTRQVMRVERQGTASGRQALSAQIVAAGTAGRMYGIIIDGGAGGITVNLRADGVVGGAILHQFVVGVNTYASIDLLDFPYANGLYGEIAAGGGGFNVHYRNG